jgi:hypothetical protein
VDHPLDDSYLKVKRAKEQLAELSHLTDSWATENPMECLLGRNADTSKVLVKIPKIRVLPPQWSILVGEIAHNLRSALDYVVYQLADDPEGVRTAFPIAKGKRAYFKPRGKRPSYRDQCLDGVPEKWAQWIDRFQPFESPLPIERTGECLLALNLLSNADKHRLRIPMFTTFELPFAFVSCDGGQSVKDLEIRYDPIEQEIHAKSQFWKSDRKAERMLVRVEPKLPPDDSFGTMDFAFGRVEIKFEHLSLMATHVEFVVGSFEPAFRPSARAD